LPKGAWFHGHGHGVGAVAIEPDGLDVPSAAHHIALDTVAFDQRGCLSPRVVLVAGSAEQTREVAQALARALTALESEVPLGPQSEAELAAARRETSAMRFACELFEAGSGWVALGEDERLRFPAQARCLFVLRAPEPHVALLPYVPLLTCVGAALGDTRAARLRQLLPHARHVALGQMQRPPLDGPVDRRHDPAGELV
jgi:hypothetical protein